jgi:hypothetical protein
MLELGTGAKDIPRSEPEPPVINPKNEGEKSKRLIQYSELTTISKIGEG